MLRLRSNWTTTSLTPSVLSDLDWARLCGVGFGDDPREQPLRPTLHGGRGNREYVAAGLQQYAAIDEPTGPEPLVIIGEHGLQAHRGGRLIDEIIDQQERAATQRLAVVLIVGNDLDRAARQG